MPLTALQKDVLAVLAGNRSEESHFAGGVVLNIADDSARYSRDFDIFHELAEEVTRASNRDVESLCRAGFQVETPSRYGEWEKEATFRKAKVSRTTENAEIDWAADSAFRFFPIERDAQLGWRLHRLGGKPTRSIARQALQTSAFDWIQGRERKAPLLHPSAGSKLVAGAGFEPATSRL